MFDHMCTKSKPVNKMCLSYAALFTCVQAFLTVPYLFFSGECGSDASFNPCIWPSNR